MGKEKLCPALWFSGFFGLAAAVHLVRLISGVSVVIDGHELSLSFSVLIVAVSGALSFILGVLSLRRPCENGGKKHSDCCQ